MKGKGLSCRCHKEGNYHCNDCNDVVVAMHHHECGIRQNILCNGFRLVRLCMGWDDCTYIITEAVRMILGFGSDVMCDVINSSTPNNATVNQFTS